MIFYNVLSAEFLIGIFQMMISGPHKLAEESKEIASDQTDMR